MDAVGVELRISLLPASLCSAGLGHHLLLSYVEPYRSDLKPVRSSSEKSFGCSQAAKCPAPSSVMNCGKAFSLASQSLGRDVSRKKRSPAVDPALPGSTHCRDVNLSTTETGDAMQYMLLIYGNEAAMKSATEADRDAMFRSYRDYTQSIIKSGHMKAGDALQPTTTATTVRVRDGKTLTTDGPFAETREQLGGYYLVEAKDLDEATKLAARIPGAQVGGIEVRPVMQLPPDYPRPGR
jgi:hypothetical protein